MDTPAEDFFLDIDLVTAGYCAMKGWPLPERYQKFSSEEIEQMKEKVSKYMGAE